MVELPAKVKVTIQQRRLATQMKGEKGGTQEEGTGVWVLVSRLPEKYRSPAIVAPPNVPTSMMEAQYIGLYSFVVSVIALSNGVLQEGKLERYLMRMNANESTPIDRTDKLLARGEYPEGCRGQRRRADHRVRRGSEGKGGDWGGRSGGVG